MGDKALYDPYWAREKTAEYAANFMYNRERQVEHLYGIDWKALNQAARELLLAQSSDWAFIMRTGTMVPYAVRRTRTDAIALDALQQTLQRRETSHLYKCIGQDAD